MKRFLFCLVVTIAAQAAIKPLLADSLKSTNYQIQEDFIGGGGLINESSGSFQAGEAIGDTGVGSSSSTNFQTKSGFNTTVDPTLTFLVNTSSVSFGALSTTTASTATGSFKVKNYTSFGYVVQIFGSAPSNGSHNLSALSPKAASSTGSEQFGINLVANTSPASFGASPVQVPSSSFSSGEATPGDINNTGYAKTNFYRYVSGETIADANASSGETDYTISYLANASPTTPTGNYSGTQTLVCTGTY